MEKNNQDKFTDDRFKKAFSNYWTETCRDLDSEGKAFARFATDTILCSRLSDIRFIPPTIHTDDSGDGKLDGIFFIINNKLISDYTELDNISSIDRLELHFIQSKHHYKGLSFDTGELKEYFDGLDSFIINKKVLVKENEKTSSKVESWLKLWKQLFKYADFSKVDFSIHVWFATNNIKNSNYDFESLLNNRISKLSNSINMSVIQHHWADKYFIYENFFKNEKLILPNNILMKQKIDKKDNLQNITNKCSCCDKLNPSDAYQCDDCGKIFCSECNEVYSFDKKNRLCKDCKSIRIEKYLLKVNNSNNDKEIVENYQYAADLDCAAAINRLGVMYEGGRCGLIKNEGKALELYEKAALLGNEWGEYNYGQCLLYGANGCEQNTEKGIEYLEKSANQNNCFAEFGLGLYYFDLRSNNNDDNAKKAFSLFKKAARGEKINAYYYVGLCYEYSIGCKLSNRNALKWYEKGSLSNDAICCYKLALAYEKGAGTEINKEKAFYYYKKAAEINPTNYMPYIINCYYYGIGIKPDYYEAINLLKSTQNYKHKNYVIANCYDKLKDFENAINYYYKEADCNKSYDRAYNKIGEYYLYGKGVSIDYKRAVECFKKSASQGNSFACEHLGDLYSKGKGVVRDIKEAVFWYRKSVKIGRYTKDRSSSKKKLFCIFAKKYGEEIWNTFSEEKKINIVRSSEIN